MGIKKKDRKILSTWVQTIWIVETSIFLISGRVSTTFRTPRIKATRWKVLIPVLSSYVRTNAGHWYSLPIRNGSEIKGSNTAVFQFISLGQPHWLSSFLWALWEYIAVHLCFALEFLSTSNQVSPDVSLAVTKLLSHTIMPRCSLWKAD